MRPKLKSDVYWIPSPDGVAFVHPGGLFSVRGRTALPLMDRVAPYLDGDLSLDDMLVGLPEDKADMVRTLVTSLAEAGLVKDVAQDEGHGLTEEELARFGPEIAYIDHYLSSAAARFERYRSSRVVCIGAGLTLAALAGAAVRSGLRELTVLLTDEVDTDLALVESLAGARPDQQLQLRAGLVGQATPWPTLLAGADLVLHVSDRPELARARELEDFGRDAGIAVAQALVTGDRALIGPVGGLLRPGWNSTWLRLASNLPHPAGGPPTRIGQVSEFLAGPTAAIVGNRLALTCLRRLTGIDPDPAQNRLAVVDLETLHSTEHVVLAHPAAGPAVPPPDPQQAVTTFRELLDRPAISRDDFSARAVALFDHLTGLFAELDEKSLPQLPLHAAQVAVSDPFGVLDTTGGPCLVRGTGTDFGQARRQAVLAAARIYAALAVDRRRLTAGPPGGPALLTHGYDLVGHHHVLVDAELAHPVLRLPTGQRDATDFRAPVGLAAARSLPAALTRGLLDHCRAITVADGRPDPVVLDPDALELTGVAAERLVLVRLSGATARLKDLTGPLGVPVVSVELIDGGEPLPLGHGVGVRLADAVAEALELVLRHGQFGQDPGYDPRREAGSLTAPDQDDPQEEPAEGLTWTALVDALHRNGYRPVAVLADHDEAIGAVLPSIVQVVLAGYRAAGDE